MQAFAYVAPSDPQTGANSRVQARSSHFPVAQTAPRTHIESSRHSGSGPPQAVAMRSRARIGRFIVPMLPTTRVSSARPPEPGIEVRRDVVAMDGGGDTILRRS